MSPRKDVIFALLAVYVIWGIDLPGHPRGSGELRPAANDRLGGTAVAEMHVSSGLAALVTATVPMWVALLGGAWGQWPTRREWAGLGVGLIGVAILSLEESLRASPAATLAITAAAASWALGSVLTTRLGFQSGLMANAAVLLAGGVLLLVASVVTGEVAPAHLTVPALAALAYLTIFGSLVVFLAYVHLLEQTRPAVATSYAYVTPAIAVGLGIWLADETIGRFGLLALPVIAGGVALLVQGERQLPSDTLAGGPRSASDQT